MIDVRKNLRLKEILYEEDGFPLGIELVSTRGTMTENQTLKAREFSENLTYSPKVDWVSITDNAGGNPQMAPIALGTPILYAGKEVVVHLTCKDLNRHGLESQLWMYASQGFHNVLALTGDYPMSGPEGLAKPVFDIDSIGLLQVIQRMNNGLEVKCSPSSSRTKRLDGTFFFPGAVCSPYKSRENTLLPQYYKLEKKIENGAEYIIPQIGYDSRKASELIAYMKRPSLRQVPVIGNAYLLTPFVAQLFSEQKIPGVVVSPELNALCQIQATSPDKGKAFFREFAAKQIAIYKGLGYKGAFLGGVHDYHEIEQILEIEESFSNDDWKVFAKEIRYSRQGEYFLFEEVADTGLADADRLASVHSQAESKPFRTKNLGVGYRMAKRAHRMAFENGRRLAPIGKRLCHKGENHSQPPKWLRLIERASKAVFFSCQDCGDCSLAETRFLCPESQCAKNLRNGPCGGTRDGRCEVLHKDCIWSRAYDRKKSEGNADALLDFVPVFQDQSLRGTSGWANYWHELDHKGKAAKRHRMATALNEQSLEIWKTT